MMRCRAFALAFLALVLSVRSEAVSIGLSPSPIATSAGGSFTLDLVVAGLGGGLHPALGSYDLDVSFDASLLSLDGVSFAVGGFLGGPVDSLQDALETVSGVWNVSEVSLLSPSELLALPQPATFTLATLSFSALAEGTTSVTLSGIAGDENGDEILDLQFGAARVEIGGGAVVPEPGAALLFACGALAVARARRQLRAA
jgi:hypothetical protein